MKKGIVAFCKVGLTGLDKYFFAQHWTEFCYRGNFAVFPFFLSLGDHGGLGVR